jgi:ABC-type branched-subunit amino acid transport system ATPase component
VTSFVGKTRHSSETAWPLVRFMPRCPRRETMLTIQHLRKSFGALVAVDDVSFAVERGTLVGLLGPNGAGKTTTVSMIAGLIAPDKGDVLSRARACRAIPIRRSGASASCRRTSRSTTS